VNNKIKNLHSTKPESNSSAEPENRQHIAAAKTATSGNAMSPRHHSGETTGTGGDAPDLAGDTPD